MQRPSDQERKEEQRTIVSMGTTFKEIKEAYMRDLQSGHRWFSDGHYNDGHKRYDEDDADCIYYNCC